MGPGHQAHTPCAKPDPCRLSGRRASPASYMGHPGYGHVLLLASSARPWRHAAVPRRRPLPQRAACRTRRRRAGNVRVPRSKLGAVRGRAAPAHHQRCAGCQARTIRVVQEQPAARLRRQLRQSLQLGAGQRDACADRTGLAARSAPKAGTSKSGHSSPVTHKGRGNGIVMREKGVRCLQTQSLRATSSDGQCIMLSGRLPPPARSPPHCLPRVRPPDIVSKASAGMHDCQSRCEARMPGI
jgi:hypothetical protein